MSDKPAILSRGTQSQRVTAAAQTNALKKVCSNLLDDATLASLVGEEAFGKFDAARMSGEVLGKDLRKVLSQRVREWAISRGATTYAHWFSPVRGPIAGEKHDTFVQIDFSNGQPIIGMADLFQSETDGSSFPNGGLRATHTAAAFMAWDTFQPPFVISETLYIPSVFLSFRGHALDFKTPLLRAEHALDLAATKLLHHLGDPAVKHVFSNVGWEQEFFLVDRELWLKRDDLTTCGRALFGVPPLGGQERSEHYFSRINPRAEAVMTQVRNRLWEIGVTISVMHNEVAPSQHEISPIFTLSARAADWNMIAMEILHRVAYENGMAALLHEKPFKGLNGSGKHNNWGINTDTGANLFTVGKTAAEQRRFVAMVAALMRAVRHHGDLLRIGVSTSGNDHRLGAQEAPPAIFTLYVGKGLEDHLRAAAEGGALDGYGVVARTQEVVPSVQPINTNLEDRNRTAPFPWCGNRFELRAVGSNQHMAWPIALVNSAIADSFQFMNAEIEKGGDADAVIRAVLKENIGVLFSGDGYDAPLLQSVAKQNGLFHLTSTPDAWAELTSAKNVAMFKRVGVFEADELEARQNIAYTRFTQDVEIEARTALHMLRHAIIPAVRADITADNAAGFKSKGITEKAALAQQLLDATDALQTAFEQAHHKQRESARAATVFASADLRAALNAARSVADQLEERVSNWPLPTVNELTTAHHF